MASHLDALKEMGFSEVRAQKALAATDNKGLEVAMDWIMAHENDLDIDDPNPEVIAATHDGKVTEEQEEEQEKSAVEIDMGSPEPPPEEAKCLKCDDCGQLLRTSVDAETHAVKFKHTNFSESTEEIQAISEEERTRKLEQARLKLEEVKKSKDEEEKKKKIQLEKDRRKHGKEMQEAKQHMQEKEMREIAEERKKQKTADRLAKQKVLDEIKRDREAKKQENKGAEKVSEAKPTVVSPPTVQTNYSECRLQIRLTDGSILTHVFGAQEQLAAVRLFVEINRTDGEAPFRLMTTFPRRVFIDEDMDTPLNQLGLVPSAVLIVARS